MINKKLETDKEFYLKRIQENEILMSGKDIGYLEEINKDYRERIKAIDLILYDGFTENVSYTVVDTEKFKLVDKVNINMKGTNFHNDKGFAGSGDIMLSLKDGGSDYSVGSFKQYDLQKYGICLICK